MNVPRITRDLIAFGSVISEPKLRLLLARRASKGESTPVQFEGSRNSEAAADGDRPRSGWTAVVALAILWTALPAGAHVGNHPSVHDTVAGILTRWERDLSHQEIKSLTVTKALSLLTGPEREVLGTEHVSFVVNVPVVVSIIRDAKWGDEPYWLKERGFSPTALRVKVAETEFDVWQKAFPAGPIGLGVNSLTGGGRNYFVTVAPGNSGTSLEISQLYPGQLRLATMQVGAQPYADYEDKIETVPPSLAGQVLLQTLRASRDVARLLNIFQFTEHPSQPKPDHVVLTWGEDPRFTQTVQWRTSPRTRRGFVEYQKKATFDRFRPKPLKRIKAETTLVATPKLLNDPLINQHSVTMRGLEPDTAYVYSVGDGSREGWTELAEFTTAPDGVKPFSFIYMGDAQNGLDRWGSLLKTAYRERPDAAFYIMAGDLVNRGAERDDWDSLFHNAAGIYDRRQLVPALGNHECQGGHPDLYLKLFSLMTNGPASIEPERAYSFEYGNALFVILDSNLKPETQTHWLDQRLAQSKAVWKFVVYHHPAYSSVPNRDNKSLREQWGPIFDKHHVDLALQGHDHAYLRTYPMKGEQRAKNSKEGTIYIVSVSGTKHYAQDPRHYTEFGMTNVSTYQVLDIQISGDRMVYRAYDQDGKLRDEFVIEK